MSKTNILGSAGRFGVRYGTLVKRRIVAIERLQRKKQICPFCGGVAKRYSKGIWNCKKCGKTFAGHAYYLETEQLKAEESEKQGLGKKEKAKILNKENTEQVEKETKKKAQKSKKSKKDTEE